MIRDQPIGPPGTKRRQRLRDLANERRRSGYRRLFVLLRRAGEPSGSNRIYRLYCEEGLTVRKRGARRKAVGPRLPISVEARPMRAGRGISSMTNAHVAGGSGS